MNCQNCGHSQDDHAYDDAMEMDGDGNIDGPTHCHGAGIDLANSSQHCTPRCACPDWKAP